MTEEEKRMLEKVRGMYGSTGRSPRGEPFRYVASWLADMRGVSRRVALDMNMLYHGDSACGVVERVECV